MSRDIIGRDQDFADFKAYGLPAPDRPSGAARLADLAFSVGSIGALLAMSTTNLGTGTWRWSPDVKSWFFLDKLTTRTAIPMEVLAGAGGGWWVRQDTRDLYWHAQTDWTIDPVSGDDTSPTTTIKTFAEFDRRHFGYRGGANKTLHLAGDIPTSDCRVLRNVRPDSMSTIFTILGTKRLVGTYTIGTYSTPSTGTNTTFKIAATGIGSNGNVSSESMIGMQVMKSDNSITATIQRNNSSGEVNISNPCSADAATNTRGNATDFANGDTVNVWDYSKLPFWPFPPDVAPASVLLGQVRLQDATSLGLPNTYSLGTSAPRLIQCIIEGGVFRGGQSGLTKLPDQKGVWSACSFIGSFEFAMSHVVLRCPSFVNAGVSLKSSAVDIANGFLSMQASSFSAPSLSSIALGSSSLACFDTDDAVTGIGQAAFDVIGGRLQIGGLGSTAIVVGSGNVKYLVYGQVPCHVVFKPSACSWTRTDPMEKEFWLSGREFNLAEVAAGDASDLTTMSCIAPHE